jgi:hypothetical protein
MTTLKIAANFIIVGIAVIPIFQHLEISAASDNKTTLIPTRDKFIPIIMVVISSYVCSSQKVMFLEYFI